jgi:hypothetical protein
VLNSAIASESVLALSGAAAAAVAWRARGQLNVTVIAKASFAFASDAQMPSAEPQAIVTAEVRHGQHPASSVRFTSDLAPYLGQADVVFTGYAWAPPGAAVRSLPVRLTIFDGQRILLDKPLLVQDSAPFQRMPIVYERAVCGADGLENPLGVGAMAGPGEPNIVDPGQPARPAGLGPIARAWPVRKRLLGSTPRSVLDGPILEIPDSLDWSYFQSAPPDQRIGHLRGGEWIVLQGLHPSVPRLRMRLPEARGVARIHGLSGSGVSEGQPLALTADTLRIDGEEQRCTVVFRGSFPVPNEAALAQMQVLAGVELPGAPLAWSSPRGSPQTAPFLSARGATPPAPKVDIGTFALEPPAEGAAPGAPALPFFSAPPGAISPLAIPSTGPKTPLDRPGTGTLALPPDEPAGAASGPPSAPPAAPPSPAPPAPRVEHRPPSAPPAAAPPRAPERRDSPPPPPPLQAAPPAPPQRPAAPPSPPKPSPALKKSLYEGFKRNQRS